MSALSPIDVAVTPQRARKAQLKMRGLAEQIHRFSEECRTVRGSVRPGPTVEFEHLDAVINALDDALVAIRTLDREVFEPSDAAYVSVRNGDPQGAVIRAMTPARDSAVHHADVIDPDLGRAVGPINATSFIIFPKWRFSTELPEGMFRFQSGKKAGKVDVEKVKRHDAVLAGRLVLDTLLDAFAFFDRCDPSIADRDAEGHLVGFPLPPLPIGGSYFRLAPDWPDHLTVEQNLRNILASEVPRGTHREITGRLVTEAGRVWCGYTAVRPHQGAAFTEGEPQVIRDLDAGFPYVVGTHDGLLPLRRSAGELFVGADRLTDLDLPDWTDDAAHPWADWWGLCVTDAGWYRDQRRPM